MSEKTVNNSKDWFKPEQLMIRVNTIGNDLKHLQQGFQELKNDFHKHVQDFQNHTVDDQRHFERMDRLMNELSIKLESMADLPGHISKLNTHLDSFQDSYNEDKSKIKGVYTGVAKTLGILVTGIGLTLTVLKAMGKL